MAQSMTIEDIFYELEQQRNEEPNLYIPVPDTPKRKLLLIGPSRAGKSTISRVLQDSLSEPENLDLYSRTQKAEPHDIRGLRIIDMPGFNDMKKKTKSSLLSNDSILNILKHQLNQNDPVHLVAFVFNLSGGIHTEDINAMLFVQKNLPELAGRTILIITHAEELNNEEKNGLVQEFFQHPDVRRNNLQNFFQTDILFVGCLRYESLNHKNHQALLNEHLNVLEMRKIFIQKCFEDLPSLKIDQPNNKSSSQASKFLKICIGLVVLAVASYFIYTSINSDSSYNPNMNIDTSHNNTESNENVTKLRDDESTQSHNVIYPQGNDITTAESGTMSDTDSNQDSKQFQSSDNPIEMLNAILVELKKNNERLERIEDLLKK